MATPTLEQHKKVREVASAFADFYKSVHGHLPIIIEQEWYRYFGDSVKIIDANVFDTFENAEVVVEKRDGERAKVEFGDLMWVR